MNKLERFGLITGIIGLFSDTIALITFFAGHWGSPITTAVGTPATSSAAGTTFTIVGSEIPFVIRTILILTLIYSWTMISWILVRRSFRLRKNRASGVIANIIYSTVAGVGVLVLPIFMMWMITYYQAGVPTRAEGDKVYAEFYAHNPKPAGIDSFCTNTLSGANNGSNCVWDQSDAAFWAVPASVIFEVPIAIALIFVFVNLIPVVYPDMSDSEMLLEVDSPGNKATLETLSTTETPTNVVAMRTPAKKSGS